MCLTPRAKLRVTKDITNRSKSVQLMCGEASGEYCNAACLLMDAVLINGL